MVHHNIWDYVAYLVYLHTLDNQSLTGFEFFVFDKFKNNSTVWFPIKATQYLCKHYLLRVIFILII